MLRILGYSNGHRIIEDLGPSMGRIAGYGGSLIHHAMTIPAPSRRPRPVTVVGLARAKDRARCGAPLIRVVFGTPTDRGGTCARNPGHRDQHQSAEVMEAENRRRRGLR